jgi:DNA-binding transcriptional LysR family regulator
MRHLLIYRAIDAVAKAGSIRKAADTLAITPSALNRRILGIEEELGVEIFERLPRGVRLSTAGELLIHNIRNHMAEIERIQSQIADLSGVRRGAVSVACSQALLPYFLPQQIEQYRLDHHGVTFSAQVRDREAAEQALLDYSADIAIVFEPLRLAEFQTILMIRQSIHAVMAPDHPLAKHKTVRLADCMEYPLALPSAPYGVRALLESAAKRKSLPLEPVVQSDSFDFLRNFAMTRGAVSFQIEIGLPPGGEGYGLASRPLSGRDVPAGLLYLGQLRGRALSVAASRFVDQLTSYFVENFDCL